MLQLPFNILIFVPGVMLNNNKLVLVFFKRTKTKYPSYLYFPTVKLLCMNNVVSINSLTLHFLYRFYIKFRKQIM